MNYVKHLKKKYFAHSWLSDMAVPFLFSHTDAEKERKCLKFLTLLAHPELLPPWQTKL